MNLSTLPDLRAAHAPSSPAIADDDTDLNNAEFADAVLRASAVLDEKGVSVGDVVAIMLPNRVEFVVAMFAAWRLGAAVTPISPTLVPAEAAYQIEDAAAKVVIVDAPLEIDAEVDVLSVDELTAGHARGRRRTRGAPRRRARATDLHQRDNRPARRVSCSTTPT